MNSVLDPRHARMPALKPTFEALALDWRPLVVPRPVNLAALARSIFVEQRRRNSAWSVAARAPAHLMLDGDAAQLRALLVDLIGPAWRALAHYGGGRIEIGEVASGSSKVYFVHDESSRAAEGSPHDSFARERSEALERAVEAVRGWSGRCSWVARPGQGFTVLFTGPDAP